MTTLQIKNKLIKSIKSVENPQLLEDLFRMLNIEVENLEKLKTPAQVKKAVASGQRDIKAGRYMTNAQADSEIDKWLSK